MSMKKILLIVMALLCWNVSYGQQRNLKENVELAIEANESIIEFLSNQLKELQNRYQKQKEWMDKYGGRKLSHEISEAELERILAQYTVKGLCENENEIRELLACTEESALAETYVQILDIYHGLCVPYRRSENEKDLERLKRLRPLECHQEGTKQLESAVSDYRFVMFELARVIKLIDEMEGTPEAIWAKLNESNETEYITENIPYAFQCLNKYINCRVNDKMSYMDEMKRELYESCPEAFSEFFK